MICFTFRWIAQLSRKTDSPGRSSARRLTLLHTLFLTKALAGFSTALRSHAASMGKAERYHETITWAYMLLLNEPISETQKSHRRESRHRGTPDIKDVTSRYLGAAMPVCLHRWKLWRIRIWATREGSIIAGPEHIAKGGGLLCAFGGDTKGRQLGAIELVVPQAQLHYAA